jgi:signal transduction histidine kinase
MSFLKRFVPDGMFGRLFALVLAAMLVSHLLTGLLLLKFFAGPPKHHGPPPAEWQRGPQLMPPAPPDFDPLMDAAPARDFHPGPPPGEAREIPRRPPPELWLAQLLQLGAVLLALWFGTRQLVKPVAQLAQAAGRLGDNLSSPPLAETGPLEAREAARGFNRMQERIRLQLEERGRFLAAVSHDLRTPLTRMRLRTTRLAESLDRDKLQADIEEMANMLDATLSYLRGAAQSESWQMLDVQALLETLAEDALEAGQQVNVSGQAAPLLALPGALRRCVGNLLDNAIQYGQRADIHVEDSAEQLVIEISDHGPGIPENRIHSVFEPFVRLEESRNRHSGGAGLGLSIALELARQHGGQLTLLNRPEGGLLARLVLPRK